MTDSSEQNNKEEIKNNNTDPKTIYVVFTQFILEELVFIGIAVALGLFLDKKCNTKCLFLIIFIMLFGFVPIYNLVKRMNQSK